MRSRYLRTALLYGGGGTPSFPSFLDKWLDFTVPSDGGNSAKPMNYANNTADGRYFRQQINYTATLARWSDGSYATGNTFITRTDLGMRVMPERSNSLLSTRDLTNAAWVKTNIIAAKNQLGLVRPIATANQASSITATADNATIIQGVTNTSTAFSASACVKRLNGTGKLYMTIDNVTWTEVPVTDTYARVSIPSQTLANPYLGFKIEKAGDSFAVDLCQLENGAFISDPIVTTTAIVKRWADRASNYKNDGSGYDNNLHGNWRAASGDCVFYGEWFGIAPSGSPAVSDGSLTLTNATFLAAIKKDGTVNKCLVRTKSNTIDYFLNGVKVLTQTATARSTTWANMTHFDAGTNGAGTYNICGYYQKIGTGSWADGQCPLSDADCIKLTT